MRILCLTQKLPWPLADGYNLRVVHHARELSRRHELHLVSLDVGELPDEVASLFASVKRLPARRPPAPRNLAQRLAWSLSVDQVVDRDPAVAECVRGAAASGGFDVLWIVGWSMLVYADCANGLAVYGDVIDEEAGNARGDFRRARGLEERLVTWKRWRLTRAYQRRFFPRVACCAFVSEQDRDAVLRDLPGLETCVVHNGVDAEYFQPRGVPEEGPSLVFEGTMSFRPNVEAALYFCREVLPELRTEHPELRFFLVGRDPAPEVRALERDGVTVTGSVPDVRPWLERASLFVAPMVGGAGQKNKLLQAWAMGKAVVATPLALGGLRVVDGENLLVANGPRALAAACDSLLRDPARRERMGRAGRETVLRSYTWERMAAELEGHLVRLGSRARP